MALDFPTAPSLGQKYPSSPIAGQPTYTWDGEKWTTTGGLTGSTPVYISDTPPVGAVEKALWWQSNSGRLFINYNDGNTLQWVAAVAAQPDLSTIAPTEALAYNGLQYNGAMEVSQELGTSGVGGMINTGRFLVDGWALFTGGPQVINAGQQQAGVYVPPAFRNSILAQLTTANASPAANDYLLFRHTIEGYRIARLAWGTVNAKPITLSFWVIANRPGTYSGSLVGSTPARTYVFSFTINASATWEYKTIIIPGDTAGTWKTDNTGGVYLNIAMMLGSGHTTATVGAWLAGTFNGATININGAAATSDNMALTGVTILPGTQAPAASKSSLLVRPFGEELETCKRYYQRIISFAPWLWAPAYPNVVIIPLTISPTMRVAPTAAYTEISYGSNSTTAGFNAVTSSIVNLQWSAGANGMSLISGSISLDARL